MGESGALLGVLGTVELPTVTMLYLELQNQEACQDCFVRTTEQNNGEALGVSWEQDTCATPTLLLCQRVWGTAWYT